MIFTDKYPVSGPGLDAFSFPEDKALLVVGDSHGQSDALKDLLDLMGRMVTPGKERNLVFLGDFIDRGPDSLGCLDVAFNEAGDRTTADNVTYLPGNHELLLADTLEVAAEGLEAAKASPSPECWLMNGGLQFLNEGFTAKGLKQPDDILDGICAFADMLPTTNGMGFAEMVRSWPSHVRMGDALCVHAGIAPKHNQAFTLDKSQESHLNGGIHWAWLRRPFLTWQRGWPLDDAPDRGALVFHGHTVPIGARASKLVHGEAVREVFCRMQTNARICVDGGAARGIGVAGAVLTADGVRLLFCPS